jgi:hypothetical protein
MVMGYDFRVKDAFCVKETREYPWPNASDPDRTLELFGIDTDYPDIFVRNKADLLVYKQTGLCTFGHIIAPDEEAPVPESMLDEDGTVQLRIQ